MSTHVPLWHEFADDKAEGELETGAPLQVKAAALWEGTTRRLRCPHIQETRPAGELELGCVARETEKDRTLSTWESSLREEREARLKTDSMGHSAGDWREISEDSGGT